MEEETVQTKPKKSNGNKVLVLIIIILFILLGACGYYIFTEKKESNKKNQDEVEKNTKKEDIKEEQKLEEIELTDTLVTDAIKTIPYHDCAGIELKLDKVDRSISEFTEEEKLNMILSIYSSSFIKTAMDSSTYTIEEKELEKYFDDLSFLNKFRPAIDTSYKWETKEPAHEGANILEDYIYPVYMKLEDNKISATVYPTGCEGPMYKGDVLRATKAMKNEEILEIEFVHHYRGDATFDEKANTFIYPIYKNKEDTTPIEQLSSSQYTDYKFDESKYDGYKITYNIKNNNLKLQSIKYLNKGN